MHRLVTIPISHYCEKARWALDRTGEAYQEEGHLPLLHWPHSFGAGGGRTVPVVVADDGRVHADSTDILQWLDRRHPQAGLYGHSAADREEITRLEETFDAKLGPATRRWGYFHVLPHKALTLAWAAQGVPAGEVRVLRTAYPVAVKILRRGMKIDASGEKRSLARIHQIFADVSARLADGRQFLVGDAFSAADLTFAALAAPAIMPADYPFRFPALDDTPAAMRDTVVALRATPAGQFVQRLYQQERTRQGEPIAL